MNDHICLHCEYGDNPAGEVLCQHEAVRLGCPTAPGLMPAGRTVTVDRKPSWCPKGREDVPDEH